MIVKERCKEQNYVSTDSTPSLEPCPKWETLTEILAEIAEEEETCTEVEDPNPTDNGVTNSKEGSSSTNGAALTLKSNNHVLICAEDDRTCIQLREVRT